MRKIIKRRGKSSPFFSIVIVDSRSDKFPRWVEKALYSVENQTLEDLEIILIDNIGRKESIGKCYNEGLKIASAEWVYFLGDDDYLSFDYLSSLKNFTENFTNNETVIVTTNCTFFSDDGKEVAAFDKMPMGAYRKSYFINNLFDESLAKYIDVTAMRKALEDGKKVDVCRWHYGYFYRQHYNNISGRKQITKIENKVYDVEGITKDFYIIDPYGKTDKIKKHFDAVRSKIFMAELALEAKVIYCEYAFEAANRLANWGGNQIKILKFDKEKPEDYKEAEIFRSLRYDGLILSDNEEETIKKIEEIIGAENDFSGNVGKVKDFAR